MRGSVLIWGAGGHGKVVADLTRICGHEIVGFIDRDRTRLGHVAEPGGAHIVIAEEDLNTALAEREGLTVMLGIGDNANRMRCVTLLGNEFLSPALIHPAATMSPSATVGAGSVVLAGAVINAAARLGRAVIINSGAIVEHDCMIGEAVHISPNATLTGGVYVGDGAWVGAGAVVAPGIRVGHRAVIGAGAVVVRDVPDEVTVVGNPAHPL